MSAITITLKQIRAHGPCEDGWQKLLRSKGKTKADDEPFPLTDVLDSNGLDDCIWCLRCLPEHSSLWRHFAVDCAEDVAHLLNDERSREALRVARRHADGQATDAELAAARAAAWAAAGDAAVDAVRAAAWAAAWAAAGDAAWAAAGDAAVDAAVDAAGAAAWAAAWDAAGDAAGDAAWAAAWDAAWDAACAKQATRLLAYLDKEGRP